jgi:hypothetical protein
VGPRGGMDDMEKRKFLPPQGLELRPIGRPACSQSLYRLRSPGSLDVNRLYGLKVWTVCCSQKPLYIHKTLKTKFITIFIVQSDVMDEKEVYNQGIFVPR